MKAYLSCADCFLNYPKLVYNGFLEVNYYISKFKENIVEKNEEDNARLTGIIQKYKRIADTGRATTQGAYGLLCYGSNNWAEASKYFQMAADGGDARAQHNYGHILREQGGPENNLKARIYSKMAEDQGDKGAQFMHAELLLKENPQQARTYYKMAANQGNTEASENYDTLSYKLHPTKQTEEKIKKVAESGSLPM
jgi:TPR repeat protein